MKREEYTSMVDMLISATLDKNTSVPLKRDDY